MSQYIEFKGKNVDLALKAAADRMNKPIEKIRYEVISYGSSGIFGLVGAKKAKIRVKAEEAFGADKDAKAQAIDLVKAAFKIEDEAAPAPVKPQKDTADDESVKKAITIGTEALQRLVDFISSEAVIEVEVRGERIIFKVTGGNSGLLIGKRGQTLEAIQYLVEKIVNKQGKERVRILVDVEGYLQTRKANLEKMATSMADKAEKTQKPVTIGQMNAYDRRTVHVHLKSNAKVRTQSVGEGYYRKLIIFPKKRRRSKQRQ